MAMEAGGCRTACHALLPDSVRHSKKSALAGEEEEAGRSKRSPTHDGGGEF